MPEKSSGIPDKLARDEMTLAAEMHQSIKVLGGPRGDIDTRESMLARAARCAGISYRQARALYYKESSDPRASVVERVRAAMAKANDKAEAHARERIEETADVGQLVARAVEVDAELRREVLALVFRRLAGAGPEDRPLDEDGEDR
ncbi:UNVERIFIED_ORG: catalase [Xanthobacter viscosus]|uniref:Uncharacterized protein n=2 Tax=Xanthobacter autotrophicus TaxID=280 RepID=A0A6C1KI51_XANAU|nr:hypothetical protein FBQ73_07185 [Xanthobacter autotrophicus]